MSALLNFQAVRYHWPGDRADVIDLAELVVMPTERVLIMGDSGCGKSTLLSLAAGVILADQGRVELMGTDWRDLGTSHRDQRRVDHVGYIFQQFNLLPFLSVLDNVLLPCLFSKVRAARAAQQGSLDQVAKRLLAQLALPPAVWLRPAAALSVGQQQRVAAARALIGQPEVVIADEPTSALDETRRDGFMSLLLRQCAEAQSALLFVSHDARLAPHFDRVVQLPQVNHAVQQREAGG